ncbi:cupin domain-containing protein [Bradyrhizobium barranii subsp. apii]|uniref:cupin domain-containing protein n=1 Tax=Bradyrhizobium barranii TaxID=2992140 RepID=UPI001CD57AF1|nr:cupin domain-containing protein [Bradyrhizobium barranii]UPU00386.1 cupin domain-containing protein [Bradyrhizobium barranii subsp. apii]
MSPYPLRTLRMLAGAAVLATNLLTLPAAAQPAGVTRTDLQRHDLSAPGREAVQVRVDLAPGSAFGRHTHPGEEIIYVLTGAIKYDVEGKPPVTLRAFSDHVASQPAATR